MRIVQLTKINSQQFGRRDPYSDSDDVGEAQQAPVVQTSPVAINADSIRCFYPRKENRIGTRLTFKDGGGFAVTELYDEVMSKILAN